VNSIIAGAVETEMHAEISRGMDENSLDDYKKKHLLGFGQVQDIADAAAFLMGPASKWITGTSMIVDGGYMAK
jgi:NAD(P)-dependent dehydrogenase (short-subunit alcohol dehydrogenase family)